MAKYAVNNSPRHRADSLVVRVLAPEITSVGTTVADAASPMQLLAVLPES
jgi:hypothetical protein